MDQIIDGSMVVTIIYKDSGDNEHEMRFTLDKAELTIAATPQPIMPLEGLRGVQMPFERATPIQLTGVIDELSRFDGPFKRTEYVHVGDQGEFAIVAPRGREADSSAYVMVPTAIVGKYGIDAATKLALSVDGVGDRRPRLDGRGERGPSFVNGGENG